MNKIRKALKSTLLFALYAFALVCNVPKMIKHKFLGGKPILKSNRAVAWILAVVVALTAIPISKIVVKAEVDTKTQDMVFNEAENTYEIYTAKGLSDFRDKVNGGELSINGKLMADITFNADNLANVADWGTTPPAESWTPISNYDFSAGIRNKYAGTFDGDNHTISGIYCDNSSTEAYCGLFGCIGSQGVVKNINIDSSYFKSVRYVGTIAGNNDGTISYCTTSKSFVYTNGSSSSAGGIVGFLASKGKVSHCTNISTIVDSLYGYAGGIVGTSKGDIEYCTNKQAQNLSNYGGGVVGCFSSSPAIISNCYNSGDISGKLTVSSICGKLYSGTITDCYNTGNITSSTTNSSDYAGGIAGILGYSGASGIGTIKNCYNVGTVSV